MVAEEEALGDALLFAVGEEDVVAEAGENASVRLDDLFVIRALVEEEAERCLLLLELFGRFEDFFERRSALWDWGNHPD